MKPASPLPWEHDSILLREERSGYEVITDANGDAVFDSMNSDVAVIHHDDEGGPDYWDEAGRQDAAFVVRTVNARDALVVAIKTLIAAGCAPEHPPAAQLAWDLAVTQGELALKLAGEKP